MRQRVTDLALMVLAVAVLVGTFLGGFEAWSRIRAHNAMDAELIKYLQQLQEAMKKAPVGK